MDTLKGMNAESSEDDTNESSEDEKAGEMLRSMRWMDLTFLGGTGKFATFKHYSTFPQPGLIVKGNVVPLPLPPCGAAAIRFSCQQQLLIPDQEAKKMATPYSNLISILDASQFQLEGPDWKPFFDSIVRNTYEELGLPRRIGVKLDRLWLCECGPFVKPRPRDREIKGGEKDRKRREKGKQVQGEDQESEGSETGMAVIGTLVICLPARHQGGDYHVSFDGNKNTFSTASTSAFGISTMAFFSDVTEKAEKLTSGERLVLTYKILAPPESATSASLIHKQNEALKAELIEFTSGCDSVKKVVYLLTYQYPRSGISLEKMRGLDRKAAYTLHNLCSEVGFYFLFGYLAPDKPGRDPNTEDDTYAYLAAVYDTSGQEVAWNIDVDYEEILSCYEPGQWTNRAVDNPKDLECDGNKSPPLTSPNHEAVLVLVPKMHLKRFIKADSVPPTLERLTEVVCQDLEKSQGLAQTREAAIEFMNIVVRRHPHPTTVGLITKWTLKLGDMDLLQACIRTMLWPTNQPTTPQLEQHLQGYRSSIGSELEKYLSRRFSENIDGIDWNYWLGDISNSSVSLMDYGLFCFSFQSYIRSDSLQENFKSWAQPLLEEKLRARTVWRVQDLRFLMATLESMEGDPEWAVNTLFPMIARGHVEPNLPRKLVTALAERQMFPGVTELCDCLFELFEEKLCISEAEICIAYNPMTGSESPCLTFIKMMKVCYFIFFQKEVLGLLEKTCKRLVAGKAAWASVRPRHLFGDFLVPLVKAMESLEFIWMPAVDEFLEVALRDVIHPRILSDDVGSWQDTFQKHELVSRLSGDYLLNFFGEDRYRALILLRKTSEEEAKEEEDRKKMEEMVAAVENLQPNTWVSSGNGNWAEPGDEWMNESVASDDGNFDNSDEDEPDNNGPSDDGLDNEAPNDKGSIGNGSDDDDPGNDDEQDNQGPGDDGPDNGPGDGPDNDTGNDESDAKLARKS